MIGDMKQTTVATIGQQAAKVDTGALQGRQELPSMEKRSFQPFPCQRGVSLEIFINRIPEAGKSSHASDERRFWRISTARLHCRTNPLKLQVAGQ
jgi:hypothetical protein